MLLREAERGWKRSVFSNSADERWKGPDGDLLHMKKSKKSTYCSANTSGFGQKMEVNLNVKWVAHSDCRTWLCLFFRL